MVESGSWNPSDPEWREEKVNCGHLHRTVEAAEKCGARNYDEKWGKRLMASFGGVARIHGA